MAAIATILPDVHTLQPDDARTLCRFCLRSHRLSEMRQLGGADGCWPDSDLGQLYVQLTGEQLLSSHEPPISDGCCVGCALRIREAAQSVAQFRKASAFWASYVNVWRPDAIGIKVETVEVPMDQNDDDEEHNDSIGQPADEDRLGFSDDADVADNRNKSTGPKRAIDFKQLAKQRQRICHICGVVVQHSLERHVQTAHSMVQCDLCERAFDHKVLLRRHFRDDHGFMESMCDSQTPVHNGVACPECGKLCINRVRLRGHMLRHRSKPIACPEAGCGGTFWLVKEMKEHCRTVHEMKDDSGIREVVYMQSGLTAVNHNPSEPSQEPHHDPLSGPIQGENCMCNNALKKFNKKDVAVLMASNERLASVVEKMLTNRNEKKSTVGHDLLPKFPIMARDVFEQFNETLDKKDVRAQLVNKLAQIGGKTPRDAIRHAAGHTIAPSLASQYTWHGLRGKSTLKTTQFGACLLEAFADAKMSEHKVGVIMGDFLRNVSDKYNKQCIQ